MYPGIQIPNRSAICIAIFQQFHRFMLTILLCGVEICVSPGISIVSVRRHRRPLAFIVEVVITVR